MFRAVLSLITKTWKQPTYPFNSRMDKYKNYLCGIYIWRKKKYEYIERTYVHLHMYIKMRNELLLHITIWLNLTNIDKKKPDTKKHRLVWFHIHKIQNQAKLIYSARNWAHNYPVGKEVVEEGTYSSAGYVRMFTLWKFTGSVHLKCGHFSV